MSRRTALRRVPLEWPIAILGAGVLTCAFQGCATAPKPAESPSAAEASEVSEPSGMAELGGVPESTNSSHKAPAPSPQGSAPELTATGMGIPAAELTSFPAPTHDSTAPGPTAPYGLSAECDRYAQVQEPLAQLGLAALRAGRIDPWVYERDASTGKLRLASSGSIPTTAASNLQTALKKVNADPFAAKLLALAHSKLTQPGVVSICAPTKYEVKVEKLVGTTGADAYRWEFSGEEPSDVQMVGCFEALYAKVPKGCDNASYMVKAADCVTTRVGTFPDDNCGPPNTASAQPNSAFAEAASGGCRCDMCGLVYRKKSGGGCKPC